MNDGYLIGVDCGTSSIRAGVFDLNGKMIAGSSQPLELKIPRVGWAEQDVSAWLAGLVKTVREAVAQMDTGTKRILGIGVTATSASVVAVDRDSRPLRDAIMWMDVRSWPQAEKIKTQVPEGFLDKIGGRLSAEWFVPKVLWLKERESDLYNHADRIVDAGDFLIHFLTNRWVGSISNATNSGFYFPSAGGWDTAMFSRIGLADLPAKLVDRVELVGSRAGSLAIEAARNLNLPSGIPVAVGGIDCHIGMIGLNSLQPGQMALIIGSSSCHLTLTAIPLFISGIWGPFESAILPDCWLIETGQPSTGSIIAWYQDQMARPDESLEDLMREAEKIPAGSEDLILIDSWQGNRSPYNESFARGALVGLSLRHQRAHILKAILEGICFGAAAAINHIEKHGGIQIHELKVGGGGTANRFWMQMHADIANKPVTITAPSEVMLLGAAICGGVVGEIFTDLNDGAGRMVTDTVMLKPRAEIHKRYLEFFQRYDEAYSRLRPLFRQMAK
jgi:FGGY-family pentulose kinase